MLNVQYSIQKQIIRIGIKSKRGRKLISTINSGRPFGFVNGINHFIFAMNVLAIN